MTCCDDNDGDVIDIVGLADGEEPEAARVVSAWRSKTAVSCEPPSPPRERWTDC